MHNNLQKTFKNSPLKSGILLVIIIKTTFVMRLRSSVGDAQNHHTVTTVTV
jgi:hypothetical protein